MYMYINTSTLIFFDTRSPRLPANFSQIRGNDAFKATCSLFNNNYLPCDHPIISIETYLPDLEMTK